MIDFEIRNHMAVKDFVGNDTVADVLILLGSGWLIMPNEISVIMVNGITMHIDTRQHLLWSISRLYQIYPDSKVHGPTWGPPGSCRPQMGTMLALWTLLSGYTDNKCQHNLCTYFSCLASGVDDSRQFGQSIVNRAGPIEIGQLGMIKKYTCYTYEMMQYKYNFLSTSLIQSKLEYDFVIVDGIHHWADIGLDAID